MLGSVEDSILIRWNVVQASKNRTPLILVSGFESIATSEVPFSGAGVPSRRPACTTS